MKLLLLLLAFTNLFTGSGVKLFFENQSELSKLQMDVKFYNFYGKSLNRYASDIKPRAQTFLENFPQDQEFVESPNGTSHFSINSLNRYVESSDILHIPNEAQKYLVREVENVEPITGQCIPEDKYTYEKSRKLVVVKKETYTV